MISIASRRRSRNPRTSRARNVPATARAKSAVTESRQNEKLAGGATSLFMVLDSDRQLVGGCIRPPRPSLPRALRRAEIWFTPPGTERKGWRWVVARRFRRLRRRITKSEER